MLKFTIVANKEITMDMALETDEIAILLDMIKRYKKDLCANDSYSFETIYNKVKALYLLDRQPDEASILQIQNILLPTSEITKNNVNNIKIKDLPFSKRTFNCLNRANIKNLGDLLCYSKNDLLKIRNLGIQSLIEIVDVLKRFNLELSKFKN